MHKSPTAVRVIGAEGDVSLSKVVALVTVGARIAYSAEEDGSTATVTSYDFVPSSSASSAAVS